METSFTLKLPYIEIGGERVRLLAPAEAVAYLQQAERKESDGDLEAARRLRESVARGQESAQAEGVRVMEATFRIPTYRDGLCIRAQAMAEMRAWAEETGIPGTNAMLSAVTADVRARLLCRSVSEGGEEVPGGWEAIPEDWRPEVSEIVDRLVTVTEDERRPLLAGPVAPQSQNPT